MRLIDADRLQKDINDYPYGYRGMINDTIARQPTVDAEPVVRCKNCKYSEYLYADRYRCIEMDDCGVDADGFCSWGEMKEDADE